MLRRLLVLTHNVESVQEVLQDDFWQKMPPLQFSFAVASLLGIDPETKQKLLEMTVPQQRLSAVLDLLNSVGGGPSPV